ncbi:MAG: 16S rRNA (uracil(1498)-N(3))-methyltransferase [Clostridia bacterium]|nr:16S rRNA (uracil(1498)-N(3))-methyltransferase [Clostridia bacterium]
MPRFFVNSDEIIENKITIRGDDAFHIARALRMAVGDTITVCDCEGVEYFCRLEKIRDNLCECAILDKKAGMTEAPVAITLFMSYPKSDKLETIVQKAVELGVREIQPFESSRCIKRPSPDKAEKQTLRLARIAAEAAKQCGRSRLPTVKAPTSFKAAIDMAKESELRLFAYEGEGTESLKNVLKAKNKPNNIAVFVGCEGGFSEDEALLAKNEGMILVNLGPRILRCETAPDYLLSAISYEYEL